MVELKIQEEENFQMIKEIQNIKDQIDEIKRKTNTEEKRKDKLDGMMVF